MHRIRNAGHGTQAASGGGIILIRAAVLKIDGDCKDGTDRTGIFSDGGNHKDVISGFSGSKKDPTGKNEKKLTFSHGAGAGGTIYIEVDYALDAPKISIQAEGGEGGPPLEKNSDQWYKKCSGGAGGMGRIRIELGDECTVNEEGGTSINDGANINEISSPTPYSD